MKKLLPIGYLYFLCVVTLLFAPQAAFSADFYVLYSSMYGPGTLDRAIKDANAAGVGPHQIFIDRTNDGTLNLQGNFATINCNVTINQIGQGKLTINGGNAFRFFDVGGGREVVIKDIVMINGASGAGGGGIVVRQDATVLVENCTISNSVALSGSAGGGAIRNLGNLTIKDCLIEGNQAVSGGGGAIKNEINRNLTIQNSIIKNNESQIGGGGGVLIVGGSSTVQISHTTLSENTTNVSGGNHGAGVYMGGGSLELLNSTLSANRILSSGGGGGIRIQGGSTSIRNCTFFGNTVPGVGGAVSQAVAGNTIITNSTLVNNGANSSGGGVWFNGGSISVNNNIILKNTSGDLIGTFGSTHGNNLIGFAPNLNWLASANTTGSSLGITAEDVFGTANPALADNGGLTHTLALVAGTNPAVDPATMSGAPNTDQRGYYATSQPRDIGSFERDGSQTALITLAGIEEFPLTYYLQDPAILLTSSIEIEPNDGTISGASVRITEGYDASTDLLALSPLPTGITAASFEASTGTLTITGAASVENYEAALRAVTFQNNGQNTGSRSVLFQVSSGALTSAPQLRTIQLEPAVSSESGTLNYASTIEVTNTQDEGAGSLRQAILTANGRSGATAGTPHRILFDEGVFATPQVIALESELPNINTHLAIIGTAQRVSLTRSSSAIAAGTEIRLLNLEANRSMLLRDMVFAEGLKGQGAALNNNGELRVENCVFINNRATVRGGAAIFNNGNLSVYNSTFESNIIGPSLHGAGIYNFSGKSLLVEASTFTNNYSTATSGPSNGGGIYNDGQAIINNSTFFGNIARNGGGVFANSGTLKLNNSTLVKNRAGFGGGGARQTLGGALMINNTIVAGNTASTGPDVSDASGSGVSSDWGNNLFGSTAGFSATGNTSGNTTSTLSAIFGVADPQLADNGGLTLTLATIGGSPALDPENAGGLLPLDQRGYGANGIRDRGAFEFNGLSFLLSSLEPSPLAYGLQDGPTVVSKTVTASSTTDLSGASIQIVSGYLQGQDVLSINAGLLPVGITAEAFDSATGSLILSGTASSQAYQQALRLVSFQSSTTSTGVRAVSFSIISGTETSNVVQRDINIVNPFISIVGLEESTLNYIADNNPKTISEEIVLSSNVLGLSSATVKINEGYAQGEDVLLLPAQSGSSITATFDATSGTLSLNGAASLLQYQQALRAIQYLNENPTAPASFSKTVSFTITRNALTSNTLSRQIEITQPVVALGDLSSGELPYFSEGSTGGILNPNISISSPGSTLIEATLQVTEGYQAGADLLATPVLPGKLRWSWNQSEGILRIWGESSLANYQQALRAVVFQHLGNQPEGTRKVTINITNGIFDNTAVQELSLGAPLPSPYTENFQFPADAVVNILSYGADLNKGEVDATAAIQKAINDNSGDISHRTMLYFPDGVYRITNSLVLNYTNTPTSSGSGRGLNIYGQSREGTIFKLDNGATGFQDKVNPKPLLSYGGTGASSATGFTNIAFMCNLFNVTLNIGSGNSGAIGLIYIANNQGSVRNVLIKSEDGDGWAAIDMERARIAGPALLKNVQTEGFDYGIRVVGSNYGMTAEHLTINNAKQAAIYNDKHIFSIRKLTTRGTGGASIQNVHPDGFITLIDSDLSGTDSAAIVNEGYLFVRNTTVSGYSNSIKDHGRLITGDIEEYLYNPMNEGEAFSTFENGTNTSLNLGEGNIPETPEVEWDDLASWVSVTDFGYQPGTAALPNFDDALPAIRAAIAFMNQPGNEHKTTLYFPPGDYRLGGANAEAENILVEGNVRRIIGNFAGLYTKMSIESGTAALFKIGSLNHPMLIIENLNVVPQFGPDRLKRMGVFENSSSSDLVLRNVYIGHGKAYKNAGATGKLYLEDVCALSHHYYVRGSEETVYPEAVPQFEFGNQEVWARQFNPEQYGDLYQSVVQINGGQLWVLGFKTEDRGNIHAKNAKMEILGGTILPSFDVNPEQPLFLIEDSETSISVGEQSRALTSTTVAGFYTRLVEERRDGVTRTFLREEAPGRLATTNPAAPTGYFGFVLPMYVSKKKLEQSIDFSAISNKVYGDEPFALQALASSGLPVSFEVLSGPATVSGDQLTITGVGEVTIEATQAGNTTYLAAPAQTQNFNVAPAEAANMIKPVLNCVSDNGDGTYTAKFGYMNKNNYTVYIPAGSKNFLTGNLEGEVPEYFMAGDVEEAFSVTFDGSNVTWTVEGPDGKKERDVAATENSPVCKVTTTGGMSSLANAEIETRVEEQRHELYPNPAFNEVSLTLDAKEQQSVNIRIFSLKGWMMYQQDRNLELGMNHLSLSVDMLPPGLYMLVIEGKSLVYTRKLSIQAR